MAFFISVLFFFLPLTLTAAESAERPVILVSVAPYRFFIEQIAKDTLQVELMVPAGASAHTYEPKARDMQRASKGNLWFTLGEPFEKRALLALQNANPRLRAVDLRQGVQLLHSSCSHHHHHEACMADTHLWLSPRIAKIQARTITNTLVESFPDQQAFYEANLKTFLSSLDALDQFICEKTASLPRRTLMVSHPAYAYFCQDYNFYQLPIEFEGKDPTSKQLTSTLEKAKAAHVRVIFTQPQYSDKAATLIAKEIGATLFSFDPYSEDYMNMMHQLAEELAKRL